MAKDGKDKDCSTQPGSNGEVYRFLTDRQIPVEIAEKYLRDLDKERQRLGPLIARWIKPLNTNEVFADMVRSTIRASVLTGALNDLGVVIGSAIELGIAIGYLVGRDETANAHLADLLGLKGED